ncbi:MAG TPA: aminopeptidase P family protein [Pyrodictiaceae archaeon]|nr:aminopeptidase P family protein [Pyrodictiaceae archaeon]HIP85335.1 aminopeptidase P family protein [Pyrodictium sp.]HIQ11104.1 aminopeptidase P family protein [Pyrodictium sp.]HIQ56328.1 aminopeptidase P family protein [Pyrodictium sp.]
MYSHLYRLEKLREKVFAEKAQVAIISLPENISYFTGYRGPGLLIVTREKVELYVPVLEYWRAQECLTESDVQDLVELIAYTTYRLPDIGDILDRVVRAKPADIIAEKASKATKVLYDNMPLEAYLKLSSKKLVSISDTIAYWRSIKEDWEIERIVQAARISMQAVLATIDYISYGTSETEAIGYYMYEACIRGASSQAFPPIIAFNENTVYPHAVPSPDNVVVQGSPILIDVGVFYEGYCSDMTRSYQIGGRDSEYRRVFEAVYEALVSAIDRIEPGVAAKEVDEVARRVLRKYGLSKYFVHSLGHGIGLQVHEKPRLSNDSQDRLEKNMVVTVEPGVYIPRKFGVRLEEMVVVTSRGAKILTKGLPIEFD